MRNNNHLSARIVILAILLSMSITSFGQNSSRYDDPLYQTAGASKELRGLFNKDGNGKGETKKREDNSAKNTVDNAKNEKDIKNTDGKVDDVTLVVSGSDVTEKDATLNALRSAIEQVYGTFVSANTEILNDELVKDEIVSVSKGNVKSYETVSVVQLPNGQTSVTVKATVSRSKLIKYAKSKGSSAEFEGQTFAMNIKLMELRSKNAMKAYEHMCEEIKGLLSLGAFDFKVELGEPVVALSYYGHGKRDYEDEINGYSVPIIISVLATPVTSQIVSLLNNTLNSIKLSQSEVDEYTKRGNYNYLYNYTMHCSVTKNNVTRPNDIVLPFGIVPLDSDDQVNWAAISAFLDYYLVSNSNPNYRLSWQQSNKNIKAINIEVPSSYKSYRPRTISDREADYLCFVDSEGNCFSSMQISKYQTQPYLSYEIEPDMPGWFSERIDLFSNWKQWQLSENEATNESSKKAKVKKSKSSSSTRPSYPEQIICKYNLSFFIPKDEIAEFKGFTLHKSGDNK